MDDRVLVTRLVTMGLSAMRDEPDGYATPSDDPEIGSIGVAAIANWLEELGRHRLVGDVQPCFTRSGAGFKFRVTDQAVQMASTPGRLEQWLDTILPIAPQYDVFISYASGDSQIADELRKDMETAGLRCFMAEKDIQVAAIWQDSIRTALLGSSSVLILLTPRSINRPWVLLETGAAWALGKPLIPALSHVAPEDLSDPVRRHQSRVIETTAQRTALVTELRRMQN